MKTTITIAFFLTISAANAQNESPINKEAIDTLVYTVVAEQPTFMDGLTGFKTLVPNNLAAGHEKLLANLHSQSKKGRLFVAFIVERDGRLTNAEVIKGGMDKESNKELCKVVEDIQGWIPGRQNGKAVRVRYVFPLEF